MVHGHPGDKELRLEEAEQPTLTIASSLIALKEFANMKAISFFSLSLFSVLSLHQVHCDYLV